MPLVKSPALSPAKLAANRANARKSTGPRTPLGKARVALNSLRSGRRAPAFSKQLQQIGSEDDLRLFDAILEPLYECFHPHTLRQKRRVERLACQVWCALKGKDRGGEKDRELDAGPAQADGLRLDPFPGRARFRIEDRRRGLRLTFWTQRVGRQALCAVDPMKIFWAPTRRPLRPFLGVSRWLPAAASAAAEKIDEQSHDVPPTQ